MHYSWSYDDPYEPTLATVTDPYGVGAKYTIGYEAPGGKPRLEKIDGECPSCGGTNRLYKYLTPSTKRGHSLLASEIVDGRGHLTDYTYYDNGMLENRVEAATTGSSRTTHFEYDPNFPGLPVLEQRPSSSGACYRETHWSYGASGELQQRTIVGTEGTYDADGDGTPEGAFTLSTVYSDHNSAGQPGSIDPPGPGFAEPDASNVVTFSYSVPGRNGMLADSRTEPIVGVTSYAGTTSIGGCCHRPERPHRRDAVRWRHGPGAVRHRAHWQSGHGLRPW